MQKVTDFRDSHCLLGPIFFSFFKSQFFCSLRISYLIVAGGNLISDKLFITPLRAYAIGTFSGSLVPRLDQDQKYWQKKPAILGRGWTKIRNTGRRQAVQHRAIHWPAIVCHGLTKIRMILAEGWLANIGRYWHCRPAIFGRGWTKIRNTGGRQAVQHRSAHSPAYLGLWLDWPKSEILAEDKPANIDRYIGRST